MSAGLITYGSDILPIQNNPPVPQRHHHLVFIANVVEFEQFLFPVYDHPGEDAERFQR